MYNFLLNLNNIFFFSSAGFLYVYKTRNKMKRKAVIVHSLSNKYLLHSSYISLYIAHIQNIMQVHFHSRIFLKMRLYLPLYHHHPPISQKIYKTQKVSSCFWAILLSAILILSPSFLGWKRIHFLRETVCVL